MTRQAGRAGATTGIGPMPGTGAISGTRALPGTGAAPGTGAPGTAAMPQFCGRRRGQKGNTLEIAPVADAGYSASSIAESYLAHVDPPSFPAGNRSRWSPADDRIARRLSNRHGALSIV